MDKLLLHIPEPFRSLIAPAFNKFVKPLEVAKLKAAFADVQPAAAQRLEDDGHSITKDGAEWMIHAAEFNLWKLALMHLGVPKPVAGILAAEIRRPHFPKVLALALPKTTSTSSAVDIVRVTADAVIEVTL